MDALNPVPRRWLYPVATILVGVMWYVAFLVLPGGWMMLDVEPSPAVPFLCFLLTSCLLGMASRPIFEWSGKGVAVITGLATSFLGSILYVWLLVLFEVAQAYLLGGNLEDFPLTLSSSLVISSFGPIMAFQFGLVTVPVAVASGLVLHWASHERPTPSPHPLAR